MPNSPCPPVPDDQWPEQIAGMKHGFAGALNVYRTMAHHPDLLEAWAPLRQHVVKESTLGPERSELVILRAAHRMNSAYEWSHHVSRARALGMTDERIASMRAAAPPAGEDGVIARAVDALLDRQRLSPGLEEELATLVGRKGVFDLLATVGFYSVLGYILMTYDTPVDADVAREMAERPLSALST